MAMIVRYNSFYDARRRWSAFDQLMTRSVMRPAWGVTSRRSLVAPMNLTENEKGFEVRVQLPGLKPEDIEVTVQENTLTVKGQYQTTSERQGEQKQWLVREISSGSFQRSITFPKTVNFDEIATNYENGVLSITVPFGEASQPRRISITPGQSEQPEASAEVR
jgi:HSP20 family protein